VRFVLGRSTGIVSIRPSPGRLGLGDCLSDTRASARSQPIEAPVLILLTGGSAGLPVRKVPRSPQRLALQWQQSFDEITERRLTHEDDPVLARHVSNLGLTSGPSGLRPDLDVAECQPIAAAVGAMIAYDGVVRIGPAPEPMVILPSLA